MAPKEPQYTSLFGARVQRKTCREEKQHIEDSELQRIMHNNCRHNLVVVHPIFRDRRPTCTIHHYTRHHVCVC